MSSGKPVNIPASVRARLRNKADELGITFDQVLQYYAMERFLFRLSKTDWADALVVKGAAMLRAWDGAVARPTRDIDFLGRIGNSPESIRAMIADCLAVEAEDGLEFSPQVAVEPITVEGRYPGTRAVIRGTLSGARVSLQLDIGVADVVVPDPGWVDYPTLLDMESPHILAYQPATAVAEKFQTMIETGLLNSRTKDYHDVWMLSRSVRFDGSELRDAIKATFDQRNTNVPYTQPAVLGDEYADQETTRTQWGAFARRMRASGVEVLDDFASVVQDVSTFIMPAAAAAAAGERFNLVWEPDRGWSPRS